MSTQIQAKVAIYPGSFDPITNGHLSIINRGLSIFDKIIVAVAINPEKKTLFTIPERVQLIEASLNGNERIEVDTFEGLTVDYARKRGVQVIVRGLRAMSDFEYEFQLGLMNRRLNRTVQTVFMMPGFRWFYISSTIIKEAAKLGGDVEGLVPPVVERALKAKYGLEVEA